MTETAHEQLEATSSLTLSIVHAAALIAEHKEVLEQRDRYQELSESVVRREMEQTERRRDAEEERDRRERQLSYAHDQIATLERRVKHHEDRRAIPAGVKWQELIERLRERGIILERTDVAVDDLVLRVEAGERARGAHGEPEFCEHCSGPFTDQQWLMDSYGGHWETCPNGVAINEAQKADHDADPFPVGARVRLADSAFYMAAPHGAYGDVVEQALGGRVRVLWTGQTESRGVFTRRLERVEQTGPDPVTAEDDEDTTPSVGDRVRVVAHPVGTDPDLDHARCPGEAGILVGGGFEDYRVRHEDGKPSVHSGPISDFELIERQP